MPVAKTTVDSNTQASAETDAKHVDLVYVKVDELKIWMCPQGIVIAGAEGAMTERSVRQIEHGAWRLRGRAQPQPSSLRHC